MQSDKIVQTTWGKLNSLFFLVKYSFDKIIFESFAEDKSEDWLTHGSEATPDRECGQEIFGEPDNEFKGKAGGRSISGYW